MSIYVRILIIGLFFFYQFGLSNLLLAFAEPIRETFSLSSSSMGVLASLYFWGDILILLPAGWLVDHWGARRIVLIVMSICVALVFLSAVFPNYYLFAATRFFEGSCGAFGMIGALKLGTFYVEKKKFALMSGIITTLGMLGSFMVSMPLSMLAERLNWRIALMIVGAIGIGILVLLFFATQKKPTQPVEKGKTPAFKKIVKTLANWQILFNGLYVCFINLPIYLLAAMWGVPMLRALAGVSASMAALIVSMLFIGNMIGSPVIGFLSDHYKKRKLFLYGGAILSFVILSIMIFTGLHQAVLAGILFFFLGFATSTQALAFAVVMEQNPRQLAGGVNSMLAMISALGGAIGQPIFGGMLSWLENSGLSTGDAYLRLSYLFLGALVIVIVCAWRIKSK